jgi:hypothetical protein
MLFIWPPYLGKFDEYRPIEKLSPLNVLSIEITVDNVDPQRAPVQ